MIPIMITPAAHFVLASLDMGPQLRPYGTAVDVRMFSRHYGYLQAGTKRRLLISPCTSAAL